ncbi:MAG: cation:proton antiporter [Puniceicoccales bacterium]|jgi:CPA2 family monovalent cation:H+ antiporter-2|nr:cation:proton antiporter [Puniceicoccales bacterium]
MSSLVLVQNIAVVLVAALIAGSLCKKIGLSSIVGYLFAGILVGPGLRLISDNARILELAQVGLVFVMFAVGLNLSLSKFRRAGAPVIIATLLGATTVLMLSIPLGQAMGWNFPQTIFAAAMLMVSSSAVIAKIIDELHITRDRTAQLALSVTVCEDIVAVIMLTILSVVVGAAGAGDTAGGGADSAAAAAPTLTQSGAVMAQEAARAAASAAKTTGALFEKIGSFVVLLIASLLFFVPKFIRRLPTSGDTELRDIGVAGVLLFLAYCADHAGFSTALGAFLFGAIVAQLPQREFIEKSFSSVRGIFSGIFFVSIGMMADPRALGNMDALILLAALLPFTIVGRALACGLALIIVGTPPLEARRAGLLLTPLGEFTFIIASIAVGKLVFPGYLYPVAIALSVVTVILAPVLNRQADAIIRFALVLERPLGITRALDAYSEWMARMRERPPSRGVWTEARPGLLAVGGEILLVTGLLKYGWPAFKYLAAHARATGADWVREAGWLRELARTERMLSPLLIGAVVVFFLAAVAWQTFGPKGVVRVLARGVAARSPAWERTLRFVFSLAAAVILGGWLNAVLPFEEISAGGDVSILGTFTLSVRLIIICALLVLAVACARHLAKTHEKLGRMLAGVIAGGDRLLDEEQARIAAAEKRQLARSEMTDRLSEWDMKLQDCTVPENARCSGKTLSALALPARFGVTVVEIERTGTEVLTPRPETLLSAGDKLLLLGSGENLDRARAEITAQADLNEIKRERGLATLSRCAVTVTPRAGRTLAELNITRDTGVRVAGIGREGRRIENPSASEKLLNGDELLLIGTSEQVAAFRKWLEGDAPAAPATETPPAAGAPTT